MKATGIVRRIDDLGRVVIPKEIRRTLHIREGDPLEIFTMEDGSIILKKYSALGELTDFASGYAESLAKASGHPTFITDRDAIVAVSGASKRDFLTKRISRKLENLMEERSTVVVKSKSEGLIPIVEDLVIRLCRFVVKIHKFSFSAKTNRANILQKKET